VSIDFELGGSCRRMGRNHPQSETTRSDPVATLNAIDILYSKHERVR
jgi:hypothetical protein